jgi:outer membrane protein assembly factor BamB
MTPIRLLLLLCALAAVPAAASDGGAPAQLCGWRGDGSGRFPEAKPALSWSATQNVRWNAAIGMSYSSPVVSGQQVLVCAEPNLLICLERSSGKERWRFAMTVADLADAAQRAKAEAYQLVEHGSGMTAATPLTDGRAVYTVCANGIVRAIGLDGRLRWASYIEAEQNTAYGRSSSPILAGGKLIVHMTNLYAFDPDSGKRLWVNSDAASTYGTPLAFSVHGTALIATSGGDVVQLADGKGVDSRIAQSANASPVAGADGVVFYSDHAVKAIRVGAAFKDEELWSCDMNGDIFGSPLLNDGILFISTGAGELFAFDAGGKGEQKPLIDARPLFDGGGGGAEPLAYSSLTLAGKYLFLTSNQGDSVVLEATREAKLVSKNRLPAGSGAAPVFSGSDMFLRAGDRLYCIGE